MNRCDNASYEEKIDVDRRKEIETETDKNKLRQKETDRLKKNSIGIGGLRVECELCVSGQRISRLRSDPGRRPAANNK